MRRLISIVLLMSLVTVAHAQSKAKLLGKWQAESAKLTSMNFDTYSFTSKGKFVFEPNSYNGLNRIISINGSYRVKGDTLLLTPENTKEVIGGFFVRSTSTTLSDTWEIVQGKTKVVPCKKTE